jgi:tetratricopeptide (TPR) repeat protein
MEKAIVLLKLGRWEPALVEFDRALVIFQQAGDSQAQARAFGNRGVLHLSRGKLPAAGADLIRATSLFDELGHDLSSAIGQHNLGYLAARRGDIPLALERYDEAERRYRKHGTTTFTLQHPVRPSPDEALAADLAELRRITIRDRSRVTQGLLRRPSSALRRQPSWGRRSLGARWSSTSSSESSRTL